MGTHLFGSPCTINPDTPLTYLLNHSAPKYFRNLAASYG